MNELQKCIPFACMHGGHVGVIVHLCCILYNRWNSMCVLNMYTSLFTYNSTHTHTHTHTLTHTHTHTITCILTLRTRHMCVYLHVHAYECLCMVQVHTLVHKHTHLPTHKHTHLPPHKHTHTERWKVHDLANSIQRRCWQAFPWLWSEGRSLGQEVHPNCWSTQVGREEE